MLKKIRKKGAISVKTIVVVSIILISFIVILFFMGFFDYEQQVSKSACKQSVVLRHNAKFGIFEAKGSIRLSCQTQLNCLTMSGDDCDLIGTEDNPVRKVKLSNDRQIAKKQIMEELANAMAECHNMLGEGELSFMPQEWKDTDYGLICSRIVFDEKAKEEIKKIEYLSFYKFLGEKKLQSGKSYLEYIYNEKPSSDYFRKSYDKIVKEYKAQHGITLPTNYRNWSIDLTFEDGYAVVAQINREGHATQWTMTIIIGTVVGLVTAAAILAAPFTGGTSLSAIVFTVAAVGAGSGAAAATAGGITYWKKDNSEFNYGRPTLFHYEIKTLNRLGVNSFEVAP